MFGCLYGRNPYMDTRTSIEPVTVLKTKSAQLIAKVQRTRHPVVITQNGKASAVLQDVDSYEEQRQTLLLLRFLAQGDGEFRQDRGIGHSDSKKHFKKLLQELRDVETLSD
jgi:prevent-host-death family protein